MQENVRVVLFDAGQTLLDFRPSMAEVVRTNLAEDGIHLDAGKSPPGPSAHAVYEGIAPDLDLPASTAAGLSFALIDSQDRHAAAPCRRISTLLEVPHLVSGSTPANGLKSVG